MNTAARNNNPRHESPRKMVHWRGVAGFVVELAIALGSYLFSVLILGAVGAMFGAMADSFILPDEWAWAAYGRQGGWVFGAALAAIGLPVGWVRPDGQRFSFPSPRKLTRSIAIRVRRKRRAKKERVSRPNAGDIGTLSDVMKEGGVFGLLGIVFGFVIGIPLAMCWMSIAMSPFGPGGWFGAIEFTSVSFSGAGMSTSHRIPKWLAFGPPLVLSAVGFVGGTVFATAAYIRFCLTVPAEVQAKIRRTKRKQILARRTHWMMLVLGVPFMLLGGLGTVSVVIGLSRGITSRDWPHVEGRVTKSTIEEGFFEDDRDVAEINYSYEVNGVTYSSDRVAFARVFSDPRPLVRRYRVGKTVQVFYDPQHPSQSVLQPGVSPLAYAWLGLMLWFLLGGFYSAFLWFERVFAKRAE